MNFLENQTVNLTNCDREPIHIPQSIQPHGVLFVLSEPELNIEQISDNTEAIIGMKFEQLLNQNIDTLLNREAISIIQGAIGDNFQEINPLQIILKTAISGQVFDGILHRSLQNKIILELEPEIGPKNPLYGNDGANFYKLAKSSITQIQQTKTLSELVIMLAEKIRKITDFDRVMVYRFAPDGSGQVIAENKIDGIETYLGLHYPDSDIPQQAKELYKLNLIRLIPDIHYQPCRLIAANPNEPPLDLSLSVLRSVSPIHREYLNNMGVTASLCISIIKNNQLWGLIACHHYTPKFTSYNLRTFCEFLSQVMSLEISSKEDNENLDYKIKLSRYKTDLIQRIMQAENFTDALVKNPCNLLNLVSAQGAAVYTDGQLATIGNTPNETQIYDLINWLSDKFEQNIWVTDALPKIYPAATEYKDVSSGLLALAITKVQKNYILWFRPEIIQTVSWGGNPNKELITEADGTVTLLPRKSFAIWKETIKYSSLPWQQFEIEAAIELRHALVGIVLRKADEIALLNLELQRSNRELDAFAYIASHDLKEPLRGIHNYSSFLLEDYGKILDAEGISKLETLVRLTKRMEDLINSLLHFSQLGRQELKMSPVDLNNLIKTVLEIFGMSQSSANIEIMVPRELPLVKGDRLMLEELFTNLISNALKYNNRTPQTVEIGFLDATPETATMQLTPSDNYWTFYVRDNGIGIPEKHIDAIFKIFKRLHPANKYGGGTGAGLTIVKKIIERHYGIIWVESNYGEGSTFYFTLPKGGIIDVEH
jgi:chemotaxis family two-component system sensor kinase Cph1